MSKKVDPAEVAAAAVEGPVELENQFIMRLPLEPAKALREAIRSGSNNLKERLGIKMEPDMRYGEVRFDHWLLHAKLVDLPSILESLKTIDNKNFYKTADICQLLICSTEEEPPPPPEEEAPKKKKDPNKVDKKYLWPHGITPPLKNVRKRRFRKTLKKKYVEAPEIEKEVKRLLRVDNEAVNVKWEIISEDQLLGPPEPGVEVEDSAPPRPDKEGKRSKKASKAANVAEHDIFGEAVSDSDADDDSNSDEDDTKGIDVLNLDDEDESSRLMMSAGEDSLAPSQDTAGAASTSRGLITQFSKDMFTKQDSMSPSSSPVESTQSSMHFPDVKEGRSARDLEMRAARLRKDLDELYTRREQRQLQQEMGGDNENVALRQRFSEILDETIATKERELQQVLDSM